jgi:hypothetical protein
LKVRIKQTVLLLALISVSGLPLACHVTAQTFTNLHYVPA